MKLKNVAVIVAALCATGGIAMASPISFSVEASNGMWKEGTTDFENLGNFLPAGAFYQVWWSADSAYGDLNDQSGANPGQLDLPTAQMTDPSGPSAYGDFVILSGSLPSDGVWGVDNTARYTDSDVNGSVISSGFVYVYVYEDGIVNVGDSYIRSPIYPPPAWGNPDKVPIGDPPDLVDVAPVGPAVLGTHFVVPEPGTMALFGIGMLTIAARRRRK